MSPRIWILAVGLVAAAPMISAADTSMSAAWAAPNWRIEDARFAAKNALIEQHAAALTDALQRDPATLPSALRTLAAHAELSWPIREAALMRFLQSLDGIEGRRVPTEAIQFLADWQSRTLVAHEENAALGTPLYNIAARAQGLQNRWQREAAMQSASVRLRSGAADFLGDWSATTDPLTRVGMLDALTVSKRSTIRAVLASAQNGITRHPEWATLAIQAALTLHDVPAMTALIVRAQGAESRPLLQACNDRLRSDELGKLLIQLHDTAPASTFALAIGVWSAKLAGNSQVEALWLDLLGDAELGSSAALALRVRPSAAALAKLHALAAPAPDVSVRAGRARLALQLDQIAEMPL